MQSSPPRWEDPRVCESHAEGKAEADLGCFPVTSILVKNEK